MPLNLSTPSEKATGLYIAFFGRKPDTAGLEFWGKSFDQGNDAQEAADRFFESEEAKKRLPSPDQEAATIVDQVYDNLFGREPDEDGREFWVDEIQSGTSVGQLVTRVLFGAQGEDAEQINQEVDRRLSEVEDDRDAGVTLEGDDSDNVLQGSDRDDALSGLAGRDEVYGGDGDDVLDGGDGDDILNGGPGDDELTGGAGTDAFVFDLATQDAEDSEDSADDGTEDGSESTDAVGPPDGAGPPEGKGPPSSVGPNRLEGTAEADDLSGGNGPDQLFGLGGDDTLSGGNGPDTLVGGAGNDGMTGGLGPDRFRFEAENAGDDTITDFFAPTDTLVFETPSGQDDEEQQTETRVTDSTIEITGVDGTIEDGDTLSITVGGNQATVPVSGNQDASGVASAIAAALASLSNVANVLANDATVTLTATADGDVEVTDLTDTISADVSAETTIVDETAVTDTPTDDGQTATESIEAPLTIEIGTEGEGSITSGDTVSADVNGEQISATLSGDEDASAIAEALAGALGVSDAVASATVGENATISVTAADGQTADVTDFRFEAANDDVTVTDEIEAGDDDATDDESEDDDDDATDRESEDRDDDATDDESEDDDAAVALPDGITAEADGNGNVLVTHAGGEVTLKNVSLHELSSENVKLAGHGDTGDEGVGDDLITDFGLADGDSMILKAGDGEDAVTQADLTVEAYKNDDGETVGVTLDTTQGEITIIGEVMPDTPIGQYVSFGA